MYLTLRSFRLAIAVSLAAFPVLASDSGSLTNFHKVDEHVYRGAQPTTEGFRQLAGMGVKTVVDLRGAEHSQAKEKAAVEGAGMRYISIPMSGMKTPSEDQISSALKVLNEPGSGPVFVHCKRGADRTGAVIACYRITHDRWDNAKALTEARNLGMSWFQVAIQRYVMGYGAPAQSAPIPALLAPGISQ